MHSPASYIFPALLQTQKKTFRSLFLCLNNENGKNAAEKTLLIYPTIITIMWSCFDTETKNIEEMKNENDDDANFLKEIKLWGFLRE